MPRPPLLPAVAATFAGLVLVLAGCGGDDAVRPGAPEVRSTLRSAGLSAEASACAADVLLESDISDRGLRSIVEADVAGQPNIFGGIEGDDVEAVEAIQEDFGVCAGAELAAQQQATSTTSAPDPTSTTAAG